MTDEMPDESNDYTWELIAGFEARISAALELHKPTKRRMEEGFYCASCGGPDWPCKTYVALGGACPQLGHPCHATQ